MAKVVLYSTNNNVEDLYTIPSIIESNGDRVLISQNRQELNDNLSNFHVDIIICDRQSFLLTNQQINKVNSNCFNIHPSLLPYNRGYHPNFWSAYDHTPSGTTIHNIDPNIDSGLIVAQTLIYFDDDETLKTSYLKLRNLSVQLFSSVYPIIKKGININNLYKNPPNLGSTNYKADFEGVLDLLPNGWDTKLGFVRELSKNKKLKRRDPYIQK